MSRVKLKARNYRFDNDILIRILYVVIFLVVTYILYRLWLLFYKCGSRLSSARIIMNRLHSDKSDLAD